MIDTLPKNVKSVCDNALTQVGHITLSLLFDYLGNNVDLNLGGHWHDPHVRSAALNYIASKLSQKDRHEWIAKKPWFFTYITDPTDEELHFYMNFFWKDHVIAPHVKARQFNYLSQHQRQIIIREYRGAIEYLPNLSDRELTQATLNWYSDISWLISPRIKPAEANKYIALAEILCNQDGTHTIVTWDRRHWWSEERLQKAMNLWAPYWRKILGIKNGN